VAETRHRARGGASRQGRGKRRRRSDAGPGSRGEAALERGGAIRSGRAVPGHGLLELGAPQGRRTPGEEGRKEGEAVGAEPERRPGKQTRSSRASARPGALSHTVRVTGRWRGPAEDARVQTARSKGRRRGREAARAATPGRETLKVDATPWRVRPSPTAGEGGKHLGAERRSRPPQDSQRPRIEILRRGTRGLANTDQFIVSGQVLTVPPVVHYSLFYGVFRMLSGILGT
jgi:hypothetical protein